jgi:O-acetyl-ADP-ribose deacetylase (regulator of RNase III)
MEKGRRRIMDVKIGDATLSLVLGDITKENTDAIVNAANSGLRGGGGVDGAIHRAGGPAIMEECRKIGYCPAGQAVVTTAGNLNATYIIHTVGPIYKGGTRGEANILKSAYLESLKQAVKKGAKSVSFPAISAGVYGYPLNEAAHIALKTTIEYLKENTTIDLVRFILFNQTIFDVFSEELQKLV